MLISERMCYFLQPRKETLRINYIPTLQLDLRSKRTRDSRTQTAKLSFTLSLIS